MLIPFLNELLQLCVKLIFGFKICNAQAFALENTEPLFHLIHPGAMHGCEVPTKRGIRCANHAMNLHSLCSCHPQRGYISPCFAYGRILLNKR